MCQLIMNFRLVSVVVYRHYAMHESTLSFSLSLLFINGNYFKPIVLLLH